MKSEQPHAVLVVDDDPLFCELTRWTLRKSGYQVDVAVTAADLRERVESSEPAVVLLDWQLGSEDGLTLLAELRRRRPDVPIVLVTATVSIELAVSAVRQGAFDFLVKPVDDPRLVATVERAIDHAGLLRRVCELERLDGGDEFEGIIGTSPAMKTVYSVIRNVAPTDVSVLVTGESGTGKELVAHAIHRRSRRAGGPFVALNMAALPRDLVEATLFGHERGAFTGAERRRGGAVEEATGGTLFLDEIGEMPLELQPKLLRFLQDRSYRRVGGTEDVRADVRIVAATNRDPLAEVQAGRLRADLYYRLAIIPVALPALRDRDRDVELIARRMLPRIAARYGKSFRDIEPSAVAQLTAHGWPGNVRELVHALERAVVLHEGELILPSMLPQLSAAGRPAPVAEVSTVTQSVDPVPPPEDAIVPLAILERQAIERAMDLCGDNATLAASRLGISPATLYRRLREWGDPTC
jgi:two-component system repressor protein LuxO